MQDKCRASRVYDASRNVVTVRSLDSGQLREFYNTVTEGIKEGLAQSFIDGNNVFPLKIGVGISAQDARATDTDLVGVSTEWQDISGSTARGNVLILYSFWAKAKGNLSGGIWREIGLKDSAGRANSLWARVVLSPTISKSISNSYLITWSLTL
jgi:hypothetical protein